MESDTEAVVTVKRSGGEGAASIDFMTQDGTATAPDDYTATKGTLVFSPGQTELQVSVPIIDDEGCEPGRLAVLLVLVWRSDSK